MRKYVVLVCVVVLSLLATATSAEAQVGRIPFTSHVVGDPDVLDPGTMAFPGGNIHMRGYTEGLTIASDNDYFDDGYRVGVVNGNLDASGLGPVWGTYHMEVAAHPGGYWEGTFTGAFTEMGPVVRMRGLGYGDFAGMQIEGTFAANSEGVLGTEGVLTILP